MSIFLVRSSSTPALLALFIACTHCSASNTSAQAPQDPIAPAQGPSAAAPNPLPSAAPSNTSPSVTPENAAAPSPEKAADVPSKPAEICTEGSVLVPGGTFTTSGMKVEAKIGPLCVDVNETTAASYAECVTAGACNATGLDCAEQSTYGKADRLSHPIVCVTFEQAQAYCSYKNKRLPRTEEWEWIARGAEEGRKFPWGDAAPTEQLCWSGKKAQPLSCPVGSYSAGDSPQGIHDLAGNVLEFTTTAQDPKSKVRIARGGSWRDGAVELVRVSRVGGFEQSYRCGFLGIRCVQDAPTAAGAVAPPAGQ